MGRAAGIELVAVQDGLGRLVVGKGKGGGFGTTLALALVIVVLSIAAGVGVSRFGGQLPLVGGLFGDGGTRTTTSPVVVEGIRKLDDLTTLRTTQSVVVTKEDPGRLGELLSGEEVIVVAVGNVDAGVRLDGLGPEGVRAEGKKVSIRLPEPEILSVSLDEEKTRLYDRDQGLLDFKPNDELAEDARGEAEGRILAVAQEADVLEQAQANAEESIRSFVLSLGFEEVEFAR